MIKCRCSHGAKVLCDIHWVFHRLAGMATSEQIRFLPTDWRTLPHTCSLPVDAAAPSVLNASTRIAGSSDRPPPPAANRPLVAVCVSGEFRALDRSIQSWHHLQSFGGFQVHFYYLSVAGYEGKKTWMHGGFVSEEMQSNYSAPCVSDGCIRGNVRIIGLGPFTNRNLTGVWPMVNDSCVLSTLHHAVTGDDRQLGEYLYGVPPIQRLCSRPAPGHILGFYRHEAADQLLKVALSYRMIVAYEKKFNVAFDWVLRMRTDIWLLSPLPHHSVMQKGAHIPKGHVLPPAINDHVAVVSREHASSYFELIDELQCSNGGKGKWPTSQLNDSTTLLIDRLRAQNVPMWVLRLGYLLVRPGATLGEYHYDCWRLALPGVGQANLSKPPVGYFDNHHYHKSTYFRFIGECCALAPAYRGCGEWPG